MMHIRNLLIIFRFFLMTNMISVKVFSQVLLKGVVVVGGSCGMCVGVGGIKVHYFFLLVYCQQRPLSVV